MAVTISYTARNFRGSTSDTDHPNYPEELRIVDAVQTALTAGFGSNSSTLAAAEADITTLSRSFVARVPLVLAANSTWASYVYIPQAATVTDIDVITPTVFASTGGGVTLAVKKTSSGGNTMLAAATYNLETPAANTLTALSLTATTADLGIAAGGLIYVAVVSDNADATGPKDAEACVFITYTVTV